MSLIDSIAAADSVNTEFQTEFNATAMDFVYGAVWRDLLGRPEPNDAADTASALDDLLSVGAISDRVAFLKKVTEECRLYKQSLTAEAIVAATSDGVKQAEEEEIFLEHFYTEASEQLKKRVRAYQHLRKPKFGKSVPDGVEFRLEEFILFSDRKTIQEEAQKKIEAELKPYQFELPESFWRVVRERVGQSTRYNRKLQNRPEPSDADTTKRELQKRISQLTAIATGEIDAKDRVRADLLTRVAKELGVTDPYTRTAADSQGSRVYINLNPVAYTQFCEACRLEAERLSSELAKLEPAN